jgi:imidazole glycerol-phosphate synthase subunit HisF
MEVDELIFLDIEATRERRGPNFELIAEIASECFMPFAYGGGVSTLEQMQKLFALGVEKVALNTALIEHPKLVTEAAALFGSQAIVASIDARRAADGSLHAVTCGGLSPLALSPVALAKRAEELGAGELLLTSVDRDGVMGGYDLALVRDVVAAVGIPVVACGGAGVPSDFALAVNEGRAQAAGAGSMLIYQNRNRQVLINFPSKRELRELLATKGEVLQ